MLEDEPRPPRQLNDKIPRDLETICLKAMAKSPARRYATARELADDLRRYLGGEPIRARPIGRIERLRHWCRRNPVAASLLDRRHARLGVRARGTCRASREQLVQSTALEGAAQQAEMLDIVNALYTSQVVERVQSHGIVVTHDYATKTGAIPLPATLHHRVGRADRRAEQDRHAVPALQRLPVPLAQGRRPARRLRARCARGLEAKPRRRRSIASRRFRAARRCGMRRPGGCRPNCIGCHNNDTNSTKRDWKVGEVGGVLEIIRPLDRDIARTHEGLRGTFMLMAAVSGALLGLSGLVLVDAIAAAQVRSRTAVRGEDRVTRPR